MKILLSVLILLTISACTTTSERQVYRVSDKQALHITGQLTLGQLSVFVNGEKTINGPFNSNNLVGQYGEHNVRTKCRMRRGFWKNTFNCDVFVDGNYSSNLTL